MSITNEHPAASPPSPSSGRQLVPHRVRRARAATYVLFLSQGIVSLSWVIRAPMIAEDAGLSLAEVGFGFSAVGLGSIVMIAAVGPLISRFGARYTSIPSMAVLGIALAMIGLTDNFGLFVTSIFLAGCASAAVEVCAATSGSVLERAYGRPLMPSFIGFMTIGMLIGGLSGGASIALGIKTLPYLAGVGGVIWLFALVACPFLLDAKHDATVGRVKRFIEYLPKPSWRLLAICIVVFVSALEAGLAGFSAIYMTRQLGAPEDLASFAVVAQLIGMAVIQMTGDKLRLRFGASVLVRGGVIVGGAVILSAMLLVQNPWFALFAFGVLGAGIALLYPAGLSAAADTQRTPAPGVATAQVVRYLGVFAVGPFLGLVSEAFDATAALSTSVVAALVLAVIFAGSLGNQRGLGGRTGGDLPEDASKAVTTQPTPV